MTKSAPFRLLMAAKNSMPTGLGFGRISNNLRLGIVALLVCVMVSALLVTMRGSAASPPACTFSDDLEPAQEPGWAFEVAQNNIPTSPTWALTVDAGAQSATHSFTSDATANDIKDDRLISPPLNVSVTSTLSFWHKFAFEDGFDGGLLEVSVDGGAWTEIAPVAFTSGGYNGVIDSGFASPIAGRNAWTGTSSSFPSMDNVVVNLSAFAGSNVRIRWRLGLDNGVLVPGAGWWIDDISITDACPGATPSASPSPSPSPSASPSPTPPGVDLSIVATASDGTVNANETYIDVIKVKNSAASNATNVQVQIVLAPGAVYLGTPTTPDPASGTGTAADPLIWNLGTLTPNAESRIYLYQRAKSEAEDNTIVWQLLDTKASVSFTLSGNSDKRQDQTLGPKVVPVGDVGDTVRHGKRPFPVAYVEYQDMAHTRDHSIFQGFFDSLIARYLEMSMNQLLPVPAQPSVGRTTTFASTPSERYRFSTVQPAGFCGGATLAEDNDPYDDDTPPPTMTNRILNGWYQLPATRGYYGSDSTVSAYPAFVAPVGLLLNIDNGCGPPGKIAYDAATLMDPDVDYNDFDTDRDGWVDFFELVYQGQPQNILGQTGADNVWPHSSGLQYYYTDGYTSHDRLRDHQDQLLFWTDDSHTTTQLADNGRPAFVRVGAYNVNAEFSDAITFAHEYGHSLGMPDEYTAAGRNTIDDWSLMSSGPGHMGIWDKQELGWIVPTLITSPLNVTAQKELKVDTHRIDWRDSNGNPYTLTDNVHNAEVYKVDLPKVQLFDPSLIPSGSWVYYSQAGNGFGYPGHVLDIAFDGNTTAGSTSLKLQFKSWFEIEKDYDYAYLQVCQLRGVPLTLQCDNLESINDAAEGGPTTGVADTNPNGTNKGNGMTCSSGASDDPTCGVAAYPEPEFITDEFDLTPYAGQDFIIRWAYSTDPGLAFRGWVIDDIELLKNGTTRIFLDDAEDPILSNDDTHAYNGWLRSNGTATQEHAYWIGVRDKTGFDADCAWAPGVTLEYANEAHGYGNSGVDDPPAYTVVDSHPQAGASDVNLNDAAWKPFPSSPGVLTANNGDVFTDCDDPAYADGPRHVDNYLDPNSSDGNWHFGWQRLKMLVNSMSGLGTLGSMTANINYTVAAPCANSPPTPGTVQFSAANYNIGEAAGSATITVTRANGSDGTVSVEYATSNGTAIAGQDYTGASGTLNFANGETSKTFTVSVTDDALDELDETVNLTLSNPTGGATLGTPKAAVLTIVDNDPLPSLSIDDVSANEGNSGTTNFIFTVTLSAASGQSVTVNYATAPGAATAGSDYVTNSNTLTFSPGDTTKTITVLVNGDTANETNEAFSVNLTNAQNATISDSEGVGTILNDDAPTVLFGAPSYAVNENADSVTISVARSGDTTAAASVGYATSDTFSLNSPCSQANTGKASERCDYATSVGTLGWAAGEDGTKSFIIPIINDVWVEGNENFTVTLSSPTGATLGSPNPATVTIVENDTDPPTTNPINDPAFFIRQLYIDFLGRLPDTNGFQDWMATLAGGMDSAGNSHPPCPNGGFGEPPTSNCDRLHVAAGFFLSDEYLNRGYFAYRFYLVSFNQRPTYAQFIPDMAQVGGPKSPDEEAASKIAYADAFVQRSAFTTKYPGLSGQPLADALLQTAGLPAGSYTAGAQTNGQILRGIAESNAASNKFLNEGIVSIQYFGFLRRDPDTIGYANNLAALNADPNNLRHMIFIFIYSDEYRFRFGP